MRYLQSIEDHYQYYKISLTEKEIKLLLRDARNEYELEYLLNSNGYSIPFSIFIEDYKYLYIISKLIKKIYGEELLFIRQQEIIYKLIKI